MTFTHRLAGPSDARAISILVDQAYAKWVPLIGRKPLPMTVDYDQALAAHRFDLLEAEGVLAGLIETVPQGEDLLIVNLAVRPDLQRQGLASQLLVMAETLAASSGLRGTRLYTNQRFEENLRFYVARGYHLEREEAVEGGVKVHMVKAAVAAEVKPRLPI